MFSFFYGESCKQLKAATASAAAAAAAEGEKGRRGALEGEGESEAEMMDLSGRLRLGCFLQVVSTPLTGTECLTAPLVCVSVAMRPSRHGKYGMG